MDKAYLKRLQKSEHARVKAVLEECLETGQLNLKDLFRSKTPIEVISEGKQPYIRDFDKNLLPSITVFGKTTLVEICPACECVNDPSLLEPYLERGLVLPALVGKYERYQPEFAEVLLSYPHLSADEFLGFRNMYFRAISEKHARAGFVCEHCIGERQKEAESLISKSQVPDTVKHFLRKELRGATIPSLQPYMYPDYLLLEEALKSLRVEDFGKYLKVGKIIECVHSLRTSQAYSVIPQMDIADLEALESTLSKQPEITVNYGIAETKDTVLKGLKLSYSPSAPLETYLDIVEPRKQRIRSLVNAIFQRAGPQNEAYLSNLQKEIERINEEVRSLESSKRGTFVNLCTNFAKENKGLVTGCIVAAGLGLAGQGLAACSSASAGLFSKLVGKYAGISPPKEAEDLKQAISKIFEPGYEKLLAHYLSKDIEIIQVWRVQEALKRARPTTKKEAKSYI